MPPLRLSDVMQPSVLTIPFSATGAEAARLMAEKAAGCLIVTDAGGVVGILTERDLLQKVMAPGRDPRSTRVSDIMTKDVLMAAPGTSLGWAVSVMAERRIRRLPVVEDGRLVGIVTATDILAGLREALAELVERGAKSKARGGGRGRPCG